MIIRFIGDVHGKMDEYQKILHPTFPSIQVGDFGLGFVDPPTIDIKDRFIRGNHDAPCVCKAHPNYIPDGTYENNMFFIGGARSEDRAMRIEDISWWADEELSQENFWNIADKYEELKPSIMITHDVPEPVHHYMLGYYDNFMSRTQQALSSLFYIHKPKLWIFGHYHKSYDDIVDGCRFICLNELEYIDINIDDYR